MGGGGKSKREGIYIYIHIADSLHCTAETDYYKAILLQ